MHTSRWSLEPKWLQGIFYFAISKFSISFFQDDCALKWAQPFFRQPNRCNTSLVLSKITNKLCCQHCGQYVCLKSFTGQKHVLSEHWACNPSKLSIKTVQNFQLLKTLDISYYLLVGVSQKSETIIKKV